MKKNIMWIIDNKFIARTEEEKEAILKLYREAYDISSEDDESDYINIVKVDVENQIAYMKKNFNIEE